QMEAQTDSRPAANPQGVPETKATHPRAQLIVTLRTTQTVTAKEVPAVVLTQTTPAEETAIPGPGMARSQLAGLKLQRRVLRLVTAVAAVLVADQRPTRQQLRALSPMRPARPALVSRSQ